VPFVTKEPALIRPIGRPAPRSEDFQIGDVKLTIIDPISKPRPKVDSHVNAAVQVSGPVSVAARPRHRGDYASA
jgi:hypothetical protein